MNFLIKIVKVSIKIITHAHLCCKATLEFIELLTDEELSEITSDMEL